MTDQKKDKGRPNATQRAKPGNYEMFMENMNAEDRTRFLKKMAIGERIMEEDREVLKRLADS